jgi:bacillithiol system protein YtxJ
MKEISSMADLDGALAASASSPVFIFKHSTACGASQHAFEQVEKYELDSEHLPVYLIKVIEVRPVSNAIAERLDIQHKSPQLILVDSGKAAWSASHRAITADAATLAEKQLSRREN